MIGAIQVESDFRHPAEEIRREIEDLLQRSGILFRAFGRGKSSGSISSKISNSPNKYTVGGKLIQDVIGIRVALYFSEDTAIVEKLLNNRYALEKDASTIDHLDSDQFAVTRHNLIFKVTPEIEERMRRMINIRPIDTTFEVQLRSILSEGWHEVDHDLRYKCKENWRGQADLDRALNGILATLETSEWSMKKIFDDLAYRHYKSKNWCAMLHNKFRLRANPELSESVLKILSDNNDLAKEILRIGRSEVILALSKSTPKIPVNLDNIFYIANYIGPKDAIALSSSPTILLEALNY